MQNQVTDNNNSTQKPDSSWIAELGRTIVLSIVLALGIRTFVAEARWIPSGSMEPTLHGSPNQWEADKIIVDKLSYKFSNPQRGDIVVFSPTKELQKEDYQDAFIKRIIALPGEQVALKNGKVYINNQPLPENTYLSPSQQTVVNVCTSGPQPPFLAKSVTIPPDSYLVLGDNRNSSYDSRCWGVVPRENIIGRAVIRFWPLNNIGGIDKSPLYP
ncbi:signal peptidase I [Fischerella thermalis CCMEE 5268]|jgi:signal peptidase I|uniref:Signal peptidase I n=3 Tax=Fischerella TaxID=1190 RepID=A0A2N6KDV2_9CYAN|nr:MULTISPECIES: signal peptidase I [Fischerella]PLZ97428.1 signal peptidase I [Fischerella thermalis CCMEE 5196]BCX09413.1 MAG: signal peptidase I [Fischerella sp.]OKH13242.1 signal peptidase I [Fischerella major NIES-592]PLZ97013.1 signal peptidase I [Fischerella thermalis CCMEE 5268]PMB41019.1 signal peptidase I [Fischerella thermalis CCMEE 5330]